MKVAVSSAGNSLEAQIDPRFGRCPYFLIVDTDTMMFEAVENTSANEVSGAGIQAAQTVVAKGVNVVITGNVGPNAYQVLSSAGVRILTRTSGTAREAVEMFRRGELKDTSSTANSRMGRGVGRGYGIRSGRGRVTDWSTPPSLPQQPVPSITTREEEIRMLEYQMKVLQQQLEQIEQKLDKLRRESVEKT